MSRRGASVSLAWLNSSNPARGYPVPSRRTLASLEARRLRAPHIPSPDVLLRPTNPPAADRCPASAHSDLPALRLANVAPSPPSRRRRRLTVAEQSSAPTRERQGRRPGSAPAGGGPPSEQRHDAGCSREDGSAGQIRQRAGHGEPEASSTKARGVSREENAWKCAAGASSRLTPRASRRGGEGLPLPLRRRM